MYINILNKIENFLWKMYHNESLGKENKRICKRRMLLNGQVEEVVMTDV